MGMVVPRFIPRHLVTTFGTRQLAATARRTRRGTVHLLEPPVDVEANHPGAVDGAEFRAGWGIAADELLVAVVSRLESWLKLESLTRTIAAVSDLAASRPVRLLVVGEGTAQGRIQQLADDVNAHHGSTVVQLTGGLLDPRPAYEAADVMVGMGGSALRTMAFATPLVVVGERGFSRVLDEDSLATFRHQGWYGLGDGRPDDLPGQIDRLLGNAALRRSLGDVGLRTVQEYYTLDAAARQLTSWYEELAETRVPLATATAEGVRSVALRVGRSALTGLATRRTNGAKEN
jgi:glycosyltransferase involved in cell wall biosynthesis